MRGEGRNRLALFSAEPNLLAVAAIFGRQQQLVRRIIQIAIGPAEIGAAFKQHEFLGRLIGALPRAIELRPILAKLIASVLRCKQPARAVESKAFAVPETGYEAPGRRKALTRLVRIVDPCAGSRFQLGAGLYSRRLRDAVLALTGIGS